MEYQSTRNDNIVVNSLEAVLMGLSTDGGLFLPKAFGKIKFDWQEVMGLPTVEMAAKIMGALLPEFEDMPGLCQKAYKGKFETEDLTPVVKAGKNRVAELFRGPTSAFKDVALSMLPQLICAAKKQLGKDEKTLILTATSGDTGKAALEGFHDIPGIGIIVFYPDGGVSQVQRLQMVTQEGANVKVCAIRGNFDDAQTGVKNVFAKAEAEKVFEGTGIALSSANSINIGRLAPQLTYYFKAYSDLLARGEIKAGEKLDFAVPTGNFGDILAGYFAKTLGLPVGKLICASNANNVLFDFLTTGHYDRKRPFIKTTSPSMDILVSSNLERMLYLACGDAARVAGWMKDLSEKGCYDVDEDTLSKLKETFFAAYASDETAAETIKKVFEKEGYLMDTHTAVAWNATEQYRAATGSDALIAVLSTASPYKFPQAVLSAIAEKGEALPQDEFEMMERLSEKTGVAIPKNLAGLKSRKVLHTDCIEPGEIFNYVMQKSREI